MILYTTPGAPNPRRVHIFAAEKQLDLDYQPVNMLKREHKSDAMMAKNPSGKIPVLELDDGRCIAESVAICRYLEAQQPEPNLFGVDGYELARVEMFNRQVENEMQMPVGMAWVNGPIVAAMGIVKPIEEAKTRGEQMARMFYQRLNGELTERDYIAGDRFTVADITTLCCIDFATNLVALKPDAELTALWRWHERVSGRDSVVANPAMQPRN